MCKDTTKKPNYQEKILFSLPETVSDKEIRVDFNAPDMSSNGGLILLGGMHGSLAWKIGQLIPDFRRKEFIQHTYMEMVCQRVGQILCGYEDASNSNNTAETIFKDTQVEKFTMDSLIKRIMLSAVYIIEKKTFVKISFSPHHRHLEEMMTALGRIAA